MSDLVVQTPGHYLDRPLHCVAGPMEPWAALCRRSLAESRDRSLIGSYLANKVMVNKVNVPGK